MQGPSHPESLHVANMEEAKGAIDTHRGGKGGGGGGGAAAWLKENCTSQETGQEWFHKVEWGRMVGLPHPESLDMAEMEEVASP